MGHIVKRGNVYFAHYYVFTKGENGQTQREFRRVSTHCSDPRAAQQRLAELEREGTDPHRPKSKWLVSQACEWYLATAVFKSDATRKMRTQKLMNLIRLIGHLDIHTLNKKALLEYIAERKQERRHPRVDEPVTAHTIKKELVSLSQVLKLCGDHDRWSGRPSDILPRFSAEYRPRKTWLNPDEYRRFHSELQNDRDRLWTDIAVYTMGRYSEVSGLRWEHFNWPESVNLRGTKTKGSDRWIPIHSALRDILEPLRQNSGLVVGHWTNCYRAMRIACDFASVPRITPTDLRRTGISLMIQNGANRNAVMAIAGHASGKMIDMVYAQMNMSAKEEAMGKMPSMPTNAPKVQSAGTRWDFVEID